MILSMEKLFFTTQHAIIIIPSMTSGNNNLDKWYLHNHIRSQYTKKLWYHLSRVTHDCDWWCSLRSSSCWQSISPLLSEALHSGAKWSFIAVMLLYSFIPSKLSKWYPGMITLYHKIIECKLTHFTNHCRQSDCVGDTFSVVSVEFSTWRKFASTLISRLTIIACLKMQSIPISIKFVP